jgi:membrane-associated phospholipid phosphatase
MINEPLIVFLNTDGVFLLIFFALCYLWFVEGEKKEATWVMLSVFLAGIVAVAFKEIFALPRPFLLTNKAPEAGLAFLYGFPSLHSALAFSLATTVTFTKKRMGAILMFLAFLIAVGRVAARVHYPEDVFFGVVIGVVMAALIQNIAKWS